MERYAHVTAGQQRAAADLLKLVLAGPRESVTKSVTNFVDGVATEPDGRAWSGRLTRGSGSGGRIRTYDQAVNSRPLYH